MPMTATQVQQLYVAYFNRPADYLGLQYWITQSPSAAATAFAASSEYAATYAGMDTGARVNAIYQNLFGHAADLPGLTYWSNQVQSGKLTIADVVVAVSNGAQGTDKAAFDAKVSAASAFTTALDTTAEVTGYSGTAANNAAKAWLAGINSAAQATAAIAGIDATVSSVTTAVTSVPGATLSLTNGGDVLSLTSVSATSKTTTGDDVIYGNTDGFLTSADIIDAGGGNDAIFASITAAGQTIAPVLTSVESVTVTTTAANAATLTINAASMIGTTTVNVKDAAANSANNYTSTSDELITVSNLAKGATLGIVGGSGTVGASNASVISATYTSAAAGDTQNVAMSSKGTTGALFLATAETVNISAAGSSNAIATLNAAAVKTLNLTGTGDLTIGASDLAASVLVNASTSTGKITFVGETAATSTTFTGGSGAATVTTASTGTVSITTGAAADTIDVSGGNSTSTIVAGAGDDRVLVGAQANVTAADSINGGDGTDTIVISDATVNGTTKTALASPRVVGFERIETTATAEATIDFNALGTFSYATFSANTASAAGAGAGAASLAATMENDDVLVISAARTGQAGAGNAAGNAFNGGNGVTLTPFLDGGSNSASVRFIGNADITGGAGGASTGGNGNGGNGGTAIDASNVERLNFDVAGTVASTGTADTVTLAGGALGAKNGTGVDGTAGGTLIVGTNATISVVSSLQNIGTTVAAKHNNLDLGTVKGTNVTVDAASFQGNLTVTAGDGNVTLTGGAGADVLTGGAGIDVISGGAGADIITGGVGGDRLSGGAGRDAFVLAANTNSTTATLTGTVSFDKISDFGKVSIATTATETQGMGNNAQFVASATAKGGADADYLDMVAGPVTVAGAQAATDVSGGSSNAGKIITAVESTKGILSLGGADAALVDTLSEWVGVANVMAAANGDVVAFEFGGNTYVFEQNATDQLVELTGVTGVTGIVVLGSAVAAGVGDIFVI